MSRLPRLVGDLLGEWELEVDGDPCPGATAVVVPVRPRDGTPAVLKVGWPHRAGAEHEHLALQTWAGGPAVRLVRADPRRSALLLERADRDLATLPVLEACAVVGELYARLHRPALPQLPRLSALTADWIALLQGIQQSPAVPRRFVVEALSYARELVDDPQTDGRLLHTDLHDHHVVGTPRGWVAISPKPISGDPCFEVAPLLWNRWTEVLAAPRARDAVVERFYAVVDAAGLDESRTRAWVVVRALVAIARQLAADRPTEPQVGVGLTVVKALPT